MFLDADRVIASAVEGVAIDAAEVANARKSDIHELIEEVEHTLPAKSDFATDRHALTKLPSGKRFVSASDNGFLPSDSG